MASSSTAKQLDSSVVESTTPKRSRLSLKEKLAYGAGDLGNGFMFDLGQVYLLKFYTDVLGISAIMQV